MNCFINIFKLESLKYTLILFFSLDCYYWQMTFNVNGRIYGHLKIKNDECVFKNTTVEFESTIRKKKEKMNRPY